MYDSHNDTGTASTPSEAAMGESVARILGGKVGKIMLHSIALLIPLKLYVVNI